MIFVTGVGGIFADIGTPGTRFAELDKTTANCNIAEGVILGGMIPKVEEALSLLESGVGQIAIVDAGNPNAFVSLGQEKACTEPALFDRGKAVLPLVSPRVDSI